MSQQPKSGSAENIEWEYQFPLTAKKAAHIRKLLANNEDAVHTGTFLMSITVYNPPSDKPLPEGHAPPYFRIRRESKDVATKTVKTGPAVHRFEEETEFPVSEIAEKHQEMLDEGYTIKYRLEKIRDLWNFPEDDTMHEVVFDQTAGVPEYMEVDAHSKEGLLRMMKKLGLKEDDRFPEGVDLYKYHYKIPMLSEGREVPPGSNLVFDEHAKDQFVEYFESDVDSEMFDKILAKQITQAKKLRARM
jgi:hypothetical protein